MIDAPTPAWFYLITMHATTISSFNDELAHAKLAALRMLRQLMHTLADLASEDLPQVKHWPGRELRLIATSILRTKPLEPLRTDRAPTPPPVDRASGPDGPPPEAPPDPAQPPPSLLARLDPTSILARSDIRTLVRDGYLPASLLDLLEPPAPSFLPTLARDRPPERSVTPADSADSAPRRSGVCSPQCASENLCGPAITSPTPRIHSRGVCTW